MECSSLFDLLGTYTLVLHQLSPYLSVSALLNLAATSKKFRQLIFQSKETFRHFDISNVKSANVEIEPIDRGGINWRSERMDESVTAEEFYGGPLRGIFSFLRRKNVLSTVQVLILDNISAPCEVLTEIICEDEYQVRILSVIGSKNLNEGKFRQALGYAVRSTRPSGTPRLRGVYIFGTNARPTLENIAAPFSFGVTNSPGAQLGAALNRRSHSALQSSGLDASINPWYRNSGKVLPRDVDMADWAGTLRTCQDVIYFDAILCRGPRHDPDSALVLANSKAFLGPQIASVALRGCELCHSLPEGPANSKDAPSSRIPLLSPLSRHSSGIKTAQTPCISSGNSDQGEKLFARCMKCCLERWCEGCGKFWCEDHYDPTKSSFTHKQRIEMLEDEDSTNAVTTTVDAREASRGGTSYLKVHLGLCIEQCLVNELMAGSGSDGMWG